MNARARQKTCWALVVAGLGLSLGSTANALGASLTCSVRASEAPKGAATKVLHLRTGAPVVVAAAPVAAVAQADVKRVEGRRFAVPAYLHNPERSTKTTEYRVVLLLHSAAQRQIGRALQRICKPNGVASLLLAIDEVIWSSTTVFGCPNEIELGANFFARKDAEAFARHFTPGAVTFDPIPAATPPAHVPGRHERSGLDAGSATRS